MPGGEIASFQVSSSSGAPRRQPPGRVMPTGPVGPGTTTSTAPNGDARYVRFRVCANATATDATATAPASDAVDVAGSGPTSTTTTTTTTTIVPSVVVPPPAT